MVSVEKATEEFKERIESGYYTTEREEAHKLAKMSEPEEDYNEHKAKRDTEAVEEFCKSEAFRKLCNVLE